MKKSSPQRRSPSYWARRSANLFGALGYVMVAIEWVIAVALYAPLLQLIPRSEPLVPAAPVVVTPIDTAASVAGFIFVIVVTVAMAVLTLVVLVKMPATIARSSKKMVDKGSATMTTATLKLMHKKNTKKRRLVIQPRIVGFLKLLFLGIPLVIAYCVRFVPSPTLEPTLALFAVVVLANMAMVAFITQYSIAVVSNVRKAELW